MCVCMLSHVGTRSTSKRCFFTAHPMYQAKQTLCSMMLWAVSEVSGFGQAQQAWLGLVSGHTPRMKMCTTQNLSFGQRNLTMPPPTFFELV